MDLALSDFDSGLLVEPLNYGPYIWRAEAYFHAGQQDRATADLDTAMRVAGKPDQADIYHARCLYLRG